MKNIGKHIGLYSLLVLCSCSNNSELLDTYHESETFRVDNSLFSTDGLLSDESIKVYTLFIDQSSEEFDYNLIMKKSSASSEWKAFFNLEEEKEADVLEWESSSNASVTAVYFNNMSIPDLRGAQDMGVTEGQQTVESIQADDVLYYNNNYSSDTKEEVIDIHFKHLLSKVRIVFKNNELEEKGYKVKSVCITDVKTSYTWTPSSGTKNLVSGGELRNINLSLISDNVYEGIFVPQTLSSTSKLIITYISGNGEIVKEESFQTGAKLVSGSRYTIGGIDFVQSSSVKSRCGKTGGLILSKEEWMF